jgi:hypothetical protein
MIPLPMPSHLCHLAVADQQPPRVRVDPRGAEVYFAVQRVRGVLEAGAVARAPDPEASRTAEGGSAVMAGSAVAAVAPTSSPSSPSSPSMVADVLKLEI